MTIQELQLRQLWGQHLLSPTTQQAAVRDLCGVQAQFFSNALHALRIRSRDFSQQAIGQTMVKSWTLRGTLHLFDKADLPLLLHEGRSHFLRPCDTMQDDPCLSAQRKAFFATVLEEAIAAGTCEREALKEVCQAAGMTPDEATSAFDAWGGLLRALCEAGRLCHMPQEKKAFCLAPPFTPMPQQEAQLELARRYFAHYGPATVRDAAYFFGLPQKQVKSWLAKLPLQCLYCEGREYFVLQDADTPPADAGLPPCLFLAGFDPLLLGYQKTESLYLLPEHLRGIFSLSGIVMPAVLLRGRVVGRWRLRSPKRLQLTLFEPLGSADETLLQAEAAQLWPQAACRFG